MEQKELQDLETLSRSALERYLNVCSDFMHYELENFDFQVVENKRLRTTSARCLFEDATSKLFLEFNLKLLHNRSKKEKYDTAAHEVAHAIEFHVFGMTNHSNRWKSIHKSMGGNGLSHHNFLDS